MEDAAAVLEYFINDVANLPAEIHHLFEELQAKDKQLSECRNAISQRDNAIQKFIRSNGSHVPYPKEEQYATAIRKQYQVAMRLQDEKLALAQKALALVDRHNRRLLSKIRSLQSDGMLPPDSAQPSVSGAGGAIKSSSSSHTRNPSRASPALQSRTTPGPGLNGSHLQTPAPSAHASPHLGGSGDNKRRKLLGQPPGSMHRAGTPNAGGHATPVPFGRTALGTKRYAQKGVPRQKKKRMEHEHGSGEDEEEDEEDDEEGGEDKRLYCFCKQVSWGNMVGCDNPDCEYEWFHWGCVGITKEPAGAWFCDECKKKLGK